MASVNKVILVGRLGKDPEMRFFQDGTAVANFSMATDFVWKDKETGEKKQKTEWHRIVAFRRLGEICGQYLAKGKQVYIEGRLQANEWTDKDGIKRYNTEIIAENMVMLGSKGDADAGRPAGEATAYASEAPMPSDDAPLSEDFQSESTMTTRDSAPPTRDSAPSDNPGAVSEDDIPF